MRRRVLLFAAWALLQGVRASVAATAPEPAGSLLHHYLENLKTLRSSFVQTLADAHGRELDRASGELIVVRPGKFSWAIHPDTAGHADADTASRAKGSPQSDASGGQLMVSDGRNLWFYDRDLEQVTVKPVDAALSATPAMLLSGTVDLRDNFSVTPAGTHQELDWVLVEPRASDADFRSALFGFAHGDLKRMILEDKLGQTATVTFQKIERNAPVDPREVSFAPPPGVDVIGTPRK